MSLATDSAIKEIRRRLSHERGAVVKNWGGRIPVALIYPNSYHVGMSNLGFQTIYHHINADDRFVCERFFFEGASASRNGHPPIPLLSLESQLPLQDFAVLAFSVSYEEDFFNLVQVLKASGAELWAERRGENDPLVIAGGACTLTNPEPLAPFVDAFAIGEGEVILPAMLNTIEAGISGSRQDLLDNLAPLPGVYVPGHSYETPPKRQWDLGLDDYATMSQIVTPETELSDMFVIEAARGCGRGCRFCIAGYLFRPMRPRSLSHLIEQGEEGLKLTRKIGLLGAAVADHPNLEDLVITLRDKGAQVSISSLRADNLSDRLLGALDKSGARNVTIAPEAGTERMRRFVNKGLSEAQILDAFDKVARNRIGQLKLYFIVGLPGETDEDAQGIVDVVLKGKAIIESHKAPTRIVIDASPFVPKAGTAFQWHPMTPARITHHRLDMLKKALAPRGVEVRFDTPESSEVQCMLGRAGREVAQAMASTETGSPSSWRRALAASGLNIDDYVYKPLPMDNPLPWASIDNGVKPKFFKMEYQRAEANKTFPVCFEGCHACGLC